MVQEHPPHWCPFLRFAHLLQHGLPDSGVSFIQMLKAFTRLPCFSSRSLRSQAAFRCSYHDCRGCISFGVALASYGQGDFAMSGFICQVLAIGFESSRLVMIQVLLQGLKMDPLVSLYTSLPFALLSTLAFSLSLRVSFPSSRSQSSAPSSFSPTLVLLSASTLLPSSLLAPLLVDPHPRCVLKDILPHHWLHVPPRRHCFGSPIPRLRYRSCRSRCLQDPQG